jgi:hypothetical protein
LDEAKTFLKQSLEDRKQQAIEAAKKAKAKGGKKKKTDEEQFDEPTAYDDDDPQKDESYNLETRADFARALKAKVKMPFLFGPIEFTGLNLP